MINEELFITIALYQGLIDMEWDSVKIKIFGHDGESFDEDAYNESFFNPDLNRSFAYLNEKDSEYREPLIRGLTQ